MSLQKNGETEISYVNSKKGIKFNLKVDKNGEFLDEEGNLMSDIQLKSLLKEQQEKSKNINK